MLNEDHEKACHAEWYKKDDPVAFALVKSGSYEYERDFELSEKTWLACVSSIKTESNTKEYFRLNDGEGWGEWGDIDAIKDAIHSDYDLNAIVPIQKLVAVEIEQTEHYAHLTRNSRFTDIVNFYDDFAEAEEAAGIIGESA